MPYTRVLPRDLFNEANLLKCYGRLWICLETAGSCAHFEAERVPFFKIEQGDSGELYIANLPLTIGDRDFILFRPLNSRRPWPLYVEDDENPDFERVEVFDDEGNLTAAMRELIGTK